MNNEDLKMQQEFKENEKKFLEYKKTLPKEPEGDVKKEYYVGCYSSDDWVYIHEILMRDGTLEDNIPKCSCECVDECKHSPTSGSYLLTDSEVKELKIHPKVKFVELNYDKYPGTYKQNPNKIIAGVKSPRYSSPVKHQRYILFGSSLFGANPTVDTLNRCGFQLKRHQQQQDPWNGNPNTIFDDQIEQYGDGSDVDIIVCDTEMWFGHIEFQNNLGGPTNYNGGNVLPGNGTCDILDLVLDSPYYLDPDFFNADPSSRLMTRWDGTIVPTETAARNWWNNNNLSSRSAKFVSPGNGGTASGDDDFGTVNAYNHYTRAACNGSNTIYQTGSQSHGTPCASQAYGRQYGWAYNSNKWFLNLYGENSSGFTYGFNMQKIFHKIKPINPAYGTQDPTISSNSWGFRDDTYNSGYYYFRSGLDGSSGVQFSSKPDFINYFRDDTHLREHVEGTYTLPGEELIDSGVIFVCSAGNRNQKLVNSDHPDYNNYYHNIPSSYANATVNSPYGGVWHNSTNRRGFPGQIGVDRTTNPYTYKTIQVGALDDEYTPDGKERKAPYSNMGNAVDVFIAADSTAAAVDDNHIGFFYNRYDKFYTINSQQSAESKDGNFNGTSSACPIFAGLLATKLQYNRSWTYADVKSWINGLGSVSSSEFYYGTEPTTPNNINWSDPYNLHGYSGIIAWDKPTGNEPSGAYDVTENKLIIYEGEDLIVSVVTDPINDGTYYYTIEASPTSSISGSDFSSGSLNGTFTISNGSGTIQLTMVEDGITEGSEYFRFRIRENSISGNILATSEYIRVDDEPPQGGDPLSQYQIPLRIYLKV